VVAANPVLDLVDFVEEGSFVALVKFALGIVEGVLDVGAVSLKGILGLYFLPHFLVLLFEFLSLLHQSFNLLFGESSLVVGNGDLSIVVCSLVPRLNIKDAISVDFEGNFDLGDSSGGGSNSIEIELSENIIVL
jgi:NAD-specific glutamate dehydrogenase